MKRALGWTVGGLAVVILGTFAVLRSGTSPSDAGTFPAGTAAAPTTAIPAPDPTPSPAPAPSGAGEPAVVTAPGAADGAEVRAEHERQHAEDREVQRERARALREEKAKLRAARKQAHDQWAAARNPDPNRPPPRHERLHLGPGIIPDPAEPSRE